MEREKTRESKWQSGFERNDRRKLLVTDKRIKAGNGAENWILRPG